LGQVHKAVGLDGTPFACKLQYPDMQSAVEADLKQLEVAFALHRRLSSWLDTREIAKEIGARVREELDYEREAKHAVLYGNVPRGINLLDYGCVRIFHPRFVGGVVDLYRGLLNGDQARIVHAYETWGFKNLNRELIDILNIWARFIYGPLLEDRTRTVADGVKPGEYGRRQAFEVHQALKERGPVTVPQEFVFMDRAAVGLGAVFLHLRSA